MIPVNADLEQKIVDAIYRGGSAIPAELRRAIELIAPSILDSSGEVFGELDHAAPAVQFNARRPRTGRSKRFWLTISPIRSSTRRLARSSARSVGTASLHLDRVFSQELLRNRRFPQRVPSPAGGGCIARQLRDLPTRGRIAIVAVHQGTNRSSLWGRCHCAPRTPHAAFNAGAPDQTIVLANSITQPGARSYRQSQHNRHDRTGPPGSRYSSTTPRALSHAPATASASTVTDDSRRTGAAARRIAALTSSMSRAAGAGGIARISVLRPLAVHRVRFRRCRRATT